MRTSFFCILMGVVVALTSCTTFSKVLKSTDYNYRYEAAKQYFAEGKYSQAALLLTDQIAMFKGTDRAEESLYLLAMSELGNGDYDAAATYFKKYYQSYPRGKYAEEARYNSGRTLFESVPDARLDQSNTIRAMSEFQNFLDYYPETRLKRQTQEMIFTLQEKLVKKELLSAKMYYNLGNYFGNCGPGESNYQACVVTAQNALKEYPYSDLREDFAIMVLRAKYGLAQQSVEMKKADRYRDTIDEYYGFANDYPESKYLKEAQKILADAQKVVHVNEDNNN